MYLGRDVIESTTDVSPNGGSDGNASELSTVFSFLLSTEEDDTNLAAVYNRTINSTETWTDNVNSTSWDWNGTTPNFFDPGGSTVLPDGNSGGGSGSTMSEDWKLVVILCGLEVFFYLGTLSIIYVLRKLRDRW